MKIAPNRIQLQGQKKPKPTSGTVLDSKARRLVDLARAGEWGVLEALIDGIEEELAEHLLEGVRLSCLNCWKAVVQDEGLAESRWIVRCFKSSPQAMGYNVADSTRALVFALALAGRTAEKSTHRKEARRIKSLVLAQFFGQGESYDQRRDTTPLIGLLNRALKVSSRLKKLDLDDWGLDDWDLANMESEVNPEPPCPLDGIVWPKGLESLRVDTSCRSSKVLKTGFLRQAPGLRAVKLSATRIVLNHSQGGPASEPVITIDETRLYSLGPGLAAVLVAESRNLNFKRLEALEVQDARTLASNRGMITFGWLALDAACLQELRAHPSFADSNNNLIWSRGYKDHRTIASLQTMLREGRLRMVTDQLIQYNKQLLSMATGEVARIFDVDDLRLADSRIYTRKGTRIAALNLADARELWATQWMREGCFRA